jgi:hypothetical protein
MMKKLNGQKGFTAVAGLLLLVIVGIIGGTGWYVWRAQQSVSESSKNTDYTVTTGVAKASESTKPATQSTTSYLVIKEWGVKLPLYNDDSNAYYTYNSSASLNVKYYDGITLHDKNFDLIKNSEGESCKGTDLYFVIRAKTFDIPKLADENSPDFIGDTSPSNFKQFPFANTYQFAADRDHVSPECAQLSKAATRDKSVSTKYDKAVQAIEKSYINIQSE